MDPIVLCNHRTNHTFHSNACATYNCWEFIQELLQCLHFEVASFGAPTKTICCAHGTVPHMQRLLNYTLSSPISQTCYIKPFYLCAVLSQQARLLTATPTLTSSLLCMKVHVFPNS